MNAYEAQRKLFMLQAAVKGYPEIKTKVKLATNLEPWGPTKEQLDEITDACNHYEDKKIIMKALWKRITTSQTKEWPQIYKSLAVFEHLLLHGPESVVDDIKEQMYSLRTLHDFQYIDEKGQDKGHSVREKSKKLLEWVSNPSILAEEKAKSESLRKKFVGISSEQSSTRIFTGAKGHNDDESSSSVRQQQQALERFERERRDRPGTGTPEKADWQASGGVRSLTPPTA
eukprot:RCo026276